MMKLNITLDNLLEEINKPQPDQELLIALTEEFSNSIERAWQLYQAGKINVKMDTMTKPMYIFATQDLPTLIKDPASNLKVIKRELSLFRNVIDVLLRPEENFK